MEALSFSLGFLALAMMGIAMAIGVAFYRRFRRSWQLLYLICLASWIADVGSHYLGWFVFEQSGLMFTDLVRISWFSIAIPYIPFDLVLMPIWLLQLVGKKTGLRTVSFFVGNVVLFVAIAATVGPHLPAELRGAGPLAVAITVFLLLQTYGVYLGSLVYAFIALRDRSIPAPRRDFRLLVGALAASIVVGDVANMLVEAYDLTGRYTLRLDLPLLVLIAFGSIGVRQARRLVGSYSAASGRADGTVDDAFFVEYGLSPRERDVALCLRSEGKNRDIAERLTVSEATINTHIRNIYRKCDVHSRFEFVRLMQRYTGPTEEA